MQQSLRFAEFKETNGMELRFWFKGKINAAVMSRKITLNNKSSNNIPAGTAWLATNYTVKVRV